jgi:glutamate-ammonia-ligase adenylyltransferase
MGYASDLELLFVREETDAAAEAQERGADALVGLIEARRDGIFHVDLRLRPYGRSGPLVSSLGQIRDYYREGGGADPFERQAWIRLRHVAGDETVGRAVEAQRDAFTYGGAPWDVAAAVHLRTRQVRELVPPGAVNLKYSAGGLLDVEYAVQYLQILHGHEHAELRTPSTLTALARLRDAGIVAAGEHDGLREGYLELRLAIEALRMVRGEARDLLLPPADSEEMQFLARRLGPTGGDWPAAARSRHAEIVHQMERIAGFYDGHFGRMSP